ncbi:MAG: arylsulfotransferase family protein, partial [Acidimicrobiales bacterium]
MTGGASVSRRQIVKGLGAGAGLLAAAALAGSAGDEPGALRTAKDAPVGAGRPAVALTSIDRGAVELAASSGPPFASRPDLRPPPIAIDVHRRPLAPGLVLTDCHGGSGQQGPIIFTSTGELVWFLPVSDHGGAARRAFNLRAQTYRGKPVLCWFEGEVVDSHGRGHYVVADSNYATVATVHAADGLSGDLHDFFLTERGTAVLTAYGTAEADLSGLGGSKSGTYLYGVIQEVELATGKLVFSWRSDHHVAFGESYALPPPPPKGPPWDYFHINSVAVDPDDGHFVVSGRNTWAAYKIHRRTGEVIWRLGGRRSAFEMGRDASFAYQHDVTPQRGGNYTIFDNEGAPWHKPPSRGIVLRLDEARRTATLVRQYRHSPAVRSDALGSVQEIPGRHVFIGWGTSAYFTEYDSTGRVVLDGRLGGRGIESYRAFMSPWTGRPAAPPAVVVRRSGGRLSVYVSWNGATDVS